MEKRNNIKKVFSLRKLTFLLAGLFVLVVLGVGQNAEAASLYFSPSTGSYAVGDTLSVSIYVSSADQAMNLASASLSFPSQMLKMNSFSKDGSILKMWTQEPVFSNSQGTAQFEGLLFDPGFTGTSGKLITLTFKVLSPGTAALRFLSGSVLANDGNGTEILNNSGSASFSFANTALFPSLGSSVTANVPQISSVTHPNQNAWYADNNPKFNWKLPVDVDSVKLLYDKNSDSTPTILYTPTISEKDLQNIPDGIYYLHVQFHSAQGWGGVSHFKFQIDTQKPDYVNLTEVVRQDLTDPKASFSVSSKDSLSGIDHYEFSIDSQLAQIWHDDGTGVYVAPTLDPGSHLLIAKAVDKASNVLANSVQFIINPLSSPVITDYPLQMIDTDTLIVKGTTQYPNSNVVFWFQRTNGEASNQTVTTDPKGNFSVVVDKKLASGIYTIWAQVVDTRGAKSNPSDKLNILVNPPAWLQLSGTAMSLLEVAIPLVALLFLLAYIIWYGWHKFSLFRQKMRKEVRAAESVVHQAFNLLKDNIQEQVALLKKTKNKRKLTQEEEKILEKLDRNLDDVGKFIKKEIKDIEKEIK